MAGRWVSTASDLVLTQFQFSSDHQLQGDHRYSHVSWASEIVAVPVRGSPNPWGLLLISVDACCLSCRGRRITVWRRGESATPCAGRRASLSLARFSRGMSLGVWGIIDVPFFLGFTYTGIVAAMRLTGSAWLERRSRGSLKRRGGGREGEGGVGRKSR